MLDLKEIQDIRDMYYRQKLSIREICIRTSRDYRTVRKYLDMSDFNKPVATKIEHPSKLDPWKATITQWLTDDISMPPKQRHTAWRVYNRLVNECEGFCCSYETVNRFVSNLKPIIVLTENGSSQNECSSQYIISGDGSWYYASNYEERYNYPYLYKPSSA